MNTKLFSFLHSRASFGALIASGVLLVQTAPVGFAQSTQPPGRARSNSSEAPNNPSRPGTGFQSLFNGMDLSGWDGNPKLWSVKDGALTGQTTAEDPIKGNTFLIWTRGTVGDFELRCSFKIVANNDTGFANSGIQYRSKVLDPANWVVGGYQADMEAGPKYTGILYEERMTRGIMAERGQKVVWNQDCEKKVTGSLGTSEELQAAIKPGEWNNYVIIAEGNHLQHFINGKQTVDVIDDCEAKRATNGVLALQLHAGQPMTVQFKDLQLKGAILGQSFSLADKTAMPGEDIKKMQGSWRAIRAEENGTALAPEDTTNIVVVVKGGAYEVLINDDSQDRGTFTVDPSRKPKQMEVRPQSGSSSGDQLPAIYEIEGDTLRVCYARQGASRPKSFDTADDSRLMMLTYKRQKDGSSR